MTSQFGFEYSTIEKTLPEIRRILVPGGRFVAISHHLESVLIEAVQLEQEIYGLALDELDLIGCARLYFETLGELPDDPAQIRPALDKVRPQSDEFSRRMRHFQEKYAEHECAKFIIGTLSFIAQSAGKTTLAERLEALDKAQSDFHLARARLEDMAKAAMSREDIESFSVMAREAGFDSVHCLKLYGDDNGLAGWQIHLS